MRARAQFFCPFRLRLMVAAIETDLLAQDEQRATLHFGEDPPEIFAEHAKTDELHPESNMMATMIDG